MASIRCRRKLNNVGDKLKNISLSIGLHTSEIMRHWKVDFAIRETHVRKYGS
jgi:hypothetical protein